VRETKHGTFLRLNCFIPIELGARLEEVATAERRHKGMIIEQALLEYFDRSDRRKKK
jgi:predicted transcriptional regulator